MEINLLDFDSRYSRDPQTLGEKLRKARIDKGMKLKEVAVIFGVSDTAVINWEIRAKVPEADKMEKIWKFITGQSIP